MSVALHTLLHETARAFLPPEWVAGFHVYETTATDAAAAADAEMKAVWRRRLQVYASRNHPGAGDDLALLPPDRTTGSWDVLVELLYRPDPRVRLVRAVPLDDLLALINHPSLTNAQKRQQIRDRIQTYLDAAIARVGQV